MATLKGLYDLIHGTPELKQRTEAARVKASWHIVNEDPATPNHAERKVWAESVLENSKATLDIEYMWLCSNVTIQANGDASTDNDIDYVVAVFVNQWAGV